MRDGYSHTRSDRASVALSSGVPSSRRGAATLVAIGSSTGGPAALRDMVLELPQTFAAPIFVVSILREASCRASRGGSVRMPA